MASIEWVDGGQIIRELKSFCKGVFHGKSRAAIEKNFRESRREAVRLSLATWWRSRPASVPPRSRWGSARTTRTRLHRAKNGLAAMVLMTVGLSFRPRISGVRAGTRNACGMDGRVHRGAV